jgi:hypothetical protein
MRSAAAKICEWDRLITLSVPAVSSAASSEDRKETTKKPGISLAKKSARAKRRDHRYGGADALRSLSRTAAHAGRAGTAAMISPSQPASSSR